MRKTTYLVFAGDQYYPIGGAEDFRGAYDDPSEALLSIPGDKDWGQVAEFDGTHLVIVAERRNGEVRVYPERMAHVIAAADTAP